MSRIDKSISKLNTKVKFGDYQLFCEDYERFGFIDNTYDFVYIQVFVNYPKFTYKRTFRFLYSILNICRISDIFTLYLRHTTNLITKVKELEFNSGIWGLEFRLCSDIVRFYKEDQIQKYKDLIYKSVIQHFFGYDVNIDYDALERDVHLKPIIL